jgi:hypothetical protein
VPHSLPRTKVADRHLLPSGCPAATYLVSLDHYSFDSEEAEPP